MALEMSKACLYLAWLQRQSEARFQRLRDFMPGVEVRQQLHLLLEGESREREGTWASQVLARSLKLLLHWTDPWLPVQPSGLWKGNGWVQNPDTGQSWALPDWANCLLQDYAHTEMLYKAQRATLLRWYCSVCRRQSLLKCLGLLPATGLPPDQAQAVSPVDPVVLAARITQLLHAAPDALRLCCDWLSPAEESSFTLLAQQALAFFQREMQDMCHAFLHVDGKGCWHLRAWLWTPGVTPGEGIAPSPESPLVMAHLLTAFTTQALKTEDLSFQAYPDWFSCSQAVQLHRHPVWLQHAQEQGVDSLHGLLRVLPAMTLLPAPATADTPAYLSLIQAQLPVSHLPRAGQTWAAMALEVAQCASPLVQERQLMLTLLQALKAKQDAQTQVLLADPEHTAQSLAQLERDTQGDPLSVLDLPLYSLSDLLQTPALYQRTPHEAPLLLSALDVLYAGQTRPTLLWHQEHPEHPAPPQALLLEDEPLPLRSTPATLRWIPAKHMGSLSGALRKLQLLQLAQHLFTPAYLLSPHTTLWWQLQAWYAPAEGEKLCLSLKDLTELADTWDLPQFRNCRFLVRIPTAPSPLSSCPFLEGIPALEQYQYLHQVLRHGFQRNPIVTKNTRGHNFRLEHSSSAPALQT